MTEKFISERIEAEKRRKAETREMWAKHYAEHPEDPTHGTPLSWRRGCRCDECRKRWNDYNNRTRKTRKVRADAQNAAILLIELTHSAFEPLPTEIHGFTDGVEWRDPNPPDGEPLCIVKRITWHDVDECRELIG